MNGIRRVVTAPPGSAHAIASDGAAPVVEMGGGARVYEVWRAPLPTGEEAEGVAWSLDPPAGGSVFRIAEFPPDDSAEPFVHATRTIDYGVIIEGELTLLLDGTETVLKVGDTFVQRQADHAWVNRGPGRCRMAVILIDGAQ